MIMFNTPILFLIFNRPKTEKRVFEQIRKIKPKYLYVAADGPRKGKEGESKKSLEARRIVDEGVDWSCEVKKLYRKENLGCKLAVSGAIDWFFDNVEEGIVLEDDCVPDVTFFRFCETMLKKYRSNPRIMHISGDNYQINEMKESNSYYFSRYPNIWGWATWRRAWEKYQINIKGWKKSSNKKIFKGFSFIERKYWGNNFDFVACNMVDTWDYQWIYNVFNHDGLAIISGVNLIDNIGFGSDATHTKGVSSLNFTTSEIRFPLKYKNKILSDRYRDLYTSREIFKINLSQVVFQYYKKYLVFKKQSIMTNLKGISLLLNKFKFIIYHLFNIKFIFNENEILPVKMWGQIIDIPLYHPLPFYSFLYKNYSTNLSRVAGYIGNKYPNSSFIDVGSNIGDSVLLMRKTCNNNVFCVEGDQKYLKLLQHNMERYNNVSIIDTYLSDKDGKMFLHVDNKLGTGNLNVFDGTDYFKVRCLDSLFHNSDDIKFLKTDTDGFDAKVIKGGEQMIKKCKPLIFFEFDDKLLKKNGDSGINLMNYLIDCGYKYFLVYDNFGLYSKSIVINREISSKKYNHYFGSNTKYYYDVLAIHSEDEKLYKTINESELKYFK